MPYEIFRLWTDPRTKETLTELFDWSYLRLVQGNEWLDILDKAEAARQKAAERQAKHGNR